MDDKNHTQCIRRSRRNIAITLGTEKLEWCGYPRVKKFEDMFNRFDRILVCGRQTDRQTPTDILRRHRTTLCIASRGTNKRRRESNPQPLVCESDALTTA